MKEITLTTSIVGTFRTIDSQKKALKRLNIETVRDILIVADIHDIASLKGACFNFIRRHIIILTVENIMQLNTERPALWTEIKAALKTKKRTEQKEQNEIKADKEATGDAETVVVATSDSEINDLAMI